MFNKTKKFLTLIYQPIRHPFKTFQKSFEIEQEWANVKLVLQPHKGKMLTLFALITYPIYKDMFQTIRNSFVSTVQSELGPGQPFQVFINSFVKTEVQTILKDPVVQQESVDFVQRLGKQQQVQDSIVTLLKQSIQDPSFLEDSKVFGKKLVLDLVQDKQIQEQTQKLIIQVVNDPIFKYEVKEFCKSLSQEAEINEAVAEILKNAGMDPSFRAAFANAFAYAFNDVLMRKDTTDKIRMFLLFLIETEKSQEQGIKGFIDMIIDKLLNKKTMISKENEFDSLLEKLLGKEKMKNLSEEHKFSGPKNSELY
ncbi:unnamed protein product [Paramecium primaurelia]|uniref:Uncharacterized protein n=2 Tax=Paramecium TaxID=5884 RepID=A0A8S1VHB0_9CILI|nr:unnamed protein product [Paramecium primaurelia]CAD8174136.1 unnamed protein product [Paramecium pentaurelia]